MGFLTGSRSDLEPIWHAYHLTVSKQLSRLIRTITQPAAPWVVNHTFRTFLIDRQGVIRVMYNGFIWSELDVLHDLKQMHSLEPQPLPERNTP